LIWIAVLSHLSPLDELREEIASRGFAFVEAPQMEALLGIDAPAWQKFAASWNDLGEDRYMADGGRYRRRRHATFDVSSTRIESRPHQPHYQGRDFNPLNGGIQRWFEPILPAIAVHPAMTAVLGTCCSLFDALMPSAQRPDHWFVEAHQFRIEATSGSVGRPTPEGAHRDGVDWVLVMLIARENIASGVTTISGLDHEALGSFTLTRPFDAALVDDSRVFHGVTAVQPDDPSRPSYRDVLVVTFRRP
jgi:hypothetical protein